MIGGPTCKRGSTSSMQLEKMVPRLLDPLVLRGVKLVAVAAALAWLLSLAGQSVLLNALVLLPALLVVRCWMCDDTEALSQRCAWRGRLRSRWRSSNGVHPAPLPHRPPSSCDRWREYVGSPVVEHAWETLCGSIVQEFIYDTWYAYLTPDREFPAEVRRILNHAFGQLAARARRVDLRSVLEDASELLMEQVELYRDTREGVLQDKAAAADFYSGDLARRERAVRARMAADGNLHPALLGPEGDYRTLRAVSDGLVGSLLDKGDHSRTAARSVARELLAGCVLRPLLMWCTPYFANRGACRLMQAAEGRGGRVEREAPPDGSHALTAAKARQLRGHWEFEQRITINAEAEACVCSPSNASSSGQAAAAAAVPPPAARLARHVRSRSYDSLEVESLLSSDQLAPQADRFYSESTGAHELRHWAQHELPQGADSPSSVQPSPGSAASQISSDSATSPAPLPRPGTAAAAAAATFPAAGEVAATQQGQQAQQGQLGASGWTASNAGQLPERQGNGEWGQHRPGSNGATSTPQAAMLWSPFQAGTFTSSAGSLVASEPAQQRQQGQQSRAAEEAEQPLRPGYHPAAGGVANGADSSAEWHHLLQSLHTGHFVAGAPAAAHFALQLPPLQSASAACPSAPDRFVGRPAAKVAAADLKTSGIKDFVVYKIRVGDDSGREWTVSRRYRHFEMLHRQLRALPSYRAKLPPKRIFVHTQNVDFVEERREALDDYLQGLLDLPHLAAAPELFEFLKPGSERFELLGGKDEEGGARRGVARHVLAATQSIGRGVVGVGVGVAGVVERGVTDVASAAVGGVGAVLSEARSGFGLRHRRSASVPEGLDEFDPGAEVDAGGGRQQRRPDALSRAGTGILRSAKKVRQALAPGGAARSSLDVTFSDGHAAVVGASSRRADAGSAAAAAQQVAGKLRPSASAGSSPSKRGRAPSLKAKSKGSLSKVQRGGGRGAAAAAEGLLAQRAAAFHPAAAPLPGLHPGKSAPDLSATGSAAWRLRMDTAQESGSRPGSGSSAPAAPFYSDQRSSLDPDGCAGISAPLYEIVDCVFQLRTRGFFRRQVYAMARQMLSLAIGDAIDGYLLSKLRLLRQEHTIGRVIQLIQSSLWPGGTWFQNSAQYLACHPKAAAASQPASPSAHARQGAPMRPERYLEPAVAHPLDEEEVREAVCELLLRRPPLALVRLVGKGPYTEGAADLYEMMQSGAFMRQLGYGLLEIAALHLCPELKALFNSLELGAGITSAAAGS